MITGFPAKQVQGCPGRQGCGSHQFLILGPGEGSVMLPGVRVIMTLMAVPTLPGCLATRLLIAACAPIASRGCLPPSLPWAVARDAAGAVLPSRGSESLLICRCGIVLSFHLHLSYSFVSWYIVSIWKQKNQKCSQNFPSLIFILCQNRIPDWSNIIFWLMCFIKLVTDPDCES